ncbi:MAG: SelT/SelW/SelH family protein [Nitrospinae bacterium]|nr:SelT/SelW/SelH family protein [Nitrospinota bacterium]
MAEEIKNSLGVTPELTRGHGGIFEVTADGETLFSKHTEGRFPTNEEILAKLKAKSS